MTEELKRLWGSNVQAVREARGWSRAEFAERLGVTVPTVWKWEKGRLAPRDDHKVAIATALNASVRTLFPLVAATA